LRWRVSDTQCASRDIFDRKWFEEAYFKGAVLKVVDGIPDEMGELTAQFSPIDKPSDWAEPL
jgi:hypothetical protein